MCSAADSGDAAADDDCDVRNRRSFSDHRRSAAADVAADSRLRCRLDDESDWPRA